MTYEVHYFSYEGKGKGGRGGKRGGEVRGAEKKRGKKERMRGMRNKNDGGPKKGGGVERQFLRHLDETAKMGRVRGKELLEKENGNRNFDAVPGLPQEGGGERAPQKRSWRGWGKKKKK